MPRPRSLTRRSQQVVDADARRNLLLAAVPPSVWIAWQPVVECVRLAGGAILHEPGGPKPYVYFPLTCAIAVTHVLSDGSGAQVAMVGREGLVGVSVLLGGGPSRTRTVVQLSGVAARIPAEMVSAELDRGGDLLQLMLRYIQALVAQMSQTAACNRHHTPQQQLCRWLLQALDRAEGNELQVTQEFIASMLGVRRETVTDAVRRLQLAGAVSVRRGHVRVLDRAALESAVCECYATVNDEYERVLPYAWR